MGRTAEQSPCCAFASSAACASLQGQPVAVFKPSDEEPFSANNPKLHRAPTGSTAEGLRRGVQPGEGAVREVHWRPALSCHAYCSSLFKWHSDIERRGVQPSLRAHNASLDPF